MSNESLLWTAEFYTTWRCGEVWMWSRERKIERSAILLESQVVCKIGNQPKLAQTTSDYSHYPIASSRRGFTSAKNTHSKSIRIDLGSRDSRAAAAGGSDGAATAGGGGR